MKPKNINKKLTLKKVTIGNLDSREMNYVHGGDIMSKKETICESNCAYCETALCTHTCDCTLILATCPTAQFHCSLTC
jgi:natural product precursor